jgi:hypothetical protein
LLILTKKFAGYPFICSGYPDIKYIRCPALLYTLVIFQKEIEEEAESGHVASGKSPGGQEGQEDDTTKETNTDTEIKVCILGDALSEALLS